MLPLTLPLTPAYPYPFPPPPTVKRANTLLIKHKLVELLPPELGEIYWSLLCNLITGKITREEFELGWNEHLASASDGAGLIDATTGRQHVINHDELAYLHNALLLSILYNTSKPTLPPASVAHTGWTSKRKRGGIDAMGEGPGADPLGEHARKRRRLKRLVAGMTKGEKKRLRLLLNNRDKKGQDTHHFPPAIESIAEKTRLGLMPASAGLKTPNSAAIQQELQRAQATPTCLESGELPDLQSLVDRMAGVAYSTSLTAGVNGDAAALMSVALDVYLKDILSALLDVASAESAKQPTGAKAKAGKKGKAKVQADKTPSSVTRDHMLSLLELSPSVLHSNHVASVEKFVAHQHLYELPPREERVHMLEERLEQQNWVLAAASSSKTPATATFPPLPSASSVAITAPGSPSKDAKAIPNDGSTSPQRKNGMEVDSATRQLIPPPSAGKAKDLAFELFPEIPAPAKAGDSTSGPVGSAKKRKKQKIGDESGSSDEETTGPPAAIATSASASLPKAADTAVAATAKETTGKEKNTTEKAKKELQRGRFGIWKLLTGILEGSSTGNQNMQSGHRFQHQSVM